MAPTMASTTVALFILWPQRIPPIQYWPRLMHSTPPATATSASPNMIVWAAETIACRPLPHSRFNVSAGVSTEQPPLMAATRERYISLASVWMTLQKTTWPTSAGSRAARLTDSRTTVAAKSVGERSLRLPPYLPIAVRAALTITTSRSGTHFSLRDYFLNRALAAQDWKPSEDVTVESRSRKTVST